MTQDTAQIDDLFRQFDDPKAQAQIVQTLSPQIMGRLRAMLGDQAPQAYGAIMPQVLRSAPLCPADMPATAWIEVVFRNALINRARPDGMQLPDLPQPGARQVASVTQLSPACRAAFERMWNRGDRYEDLARYFNRPASELRDWMGRALVQLDGGQLDAPRAHLAAEYVLGVLSRAEAATFETLAAQDHDLARAVARWQVIFVALAKTDLCVDVPSALQNKALRDAAASPPRGRALVLPALIGSVLALAVIAGMSWIGGRT